MLRLLQVRGSSSGKPVPRVKLGAELTRHDALLLLLLSTTSPHPLLSHSSKSSP